MRVSPCSIIYGSTGQITPSFDGDENTILVVCIVLFLLHLFLLHLFLLEQKHRAFVAMLGSKVAPVLQQTQSRRQGHGLPNLPPVIQT